MSFRQEFKYRVTMAEYYQMKENLKINGMKLLHNPRKVLSVYFDSADTIMFSDSEEGLLPRKKVRIRWYNKNNKFTLENKISSIEGRFKTTRHLKNVDSIHKALRYQIVEQEDGLLFPSLKVSYNRSYFSLAKMRITFDNEITYHNLRLNSLIKYRDPECVIEIKVPEEISSDFIQRIVPYPTARFSKYSRGLLLSQGRLSEY